MNLLLLLLFPMVCLSQLVLLDQLLDVEQDYYTILQTIIPQRFKIHQLINFDIDKTQTSNSKRLFANKFGTVEELSNALFGDVKYIQNFNLSAPMSYNYEDYEVSENSEVSVLTEQLIGGLVTKLYKLYKEFKEILVIVDGMEAEDYIALYDLIYDAEEALKGDKEFYSPQSFQNETIESIDYLGNFEWEGIQPAYKLFYKSYVPYSDEDFEILESFTQPLDDEKVEAQIFLSILKIPILIVKLIAKIIWNLAALKKLIKILENKICLLIISIIQKICRLILYIKKKLSFKIKVILYAIKSGELIRKILRIVFLIIRKLKILSWILRDLLYRYKWKLIFLVKKAEKTSLIVALFFKELVYKKLGIVKSNLEGKLDKKDFINDYDDWSNFDDYKYFEEFSNYIYKEPGTYKSNIDPELEKIIKENIDRFNDNGELTNEDEQDYEDWNLRFELKEEYGFDSVRLNTEKFI